MDLTDSRTMEKDEMTKRRGQRLYMSEYLAVMLVQEWGKGIWMVYALWM